MAEMTPNRRRVATLIVVIGSALIGERVVALMGEDSEVVQPASSPDRSRNRSGADASPSVTGVSSTRVQLDRLDARQQALAADRGTATAPQPTLFDSVSWQPAAAKAAARAPAPKPSAPPFPYAYLGGLSEDGIRTAFFTQGNRVLPVKAGDTVDAVFRIDQMNEKQMTLTYLPLNERLTVALGSAP